MRKHETEKLDLDITSILQVLDIEKGKGVLSVKLDGHQMKIFFEQGHVVDINPKTISLEEALEGFLESDKLHRHVSLECETHNFDSKKDEIVPFKFENIKNPINDLDIPSILRVFDIDNGKGILSVNLGDINRKIFIKDGSIANIEPDDISMKETIEQYIKCKELNQNVSFKCVIHYNGNEPNNEINDNLNTTEIPVSPKNNPNKIAKQDVKMTKKEEFLGSGHLIDIIKEDLGKAILTVNIWRTSNESIILSFNKEPSLVKVFNKISKILISSLKKSSLPNQDGYYLISLENKRFALILPTGDFQIGLIVDSTQIEIGLVLNVTLPKLMNAFNEILLKKKEVV